MVDPNALDYKQEEKKARKKRHRTMEAVIDLGLAAIAEAVDLRSTRNRHPHPARDVLVQWFKDFDDAEHGIGPEQD